VVVEEPCYPGHLGEAIVHESSQYLREGLEEDNNMEGGGSVIGGLVRLVQDYTVRLFEGGRVEPLSDN